MVMVTLAAAPGPYHSRGMPLAAQEPMGAALGAAVLTVFCVSEHDMGVEICGSTLYERCV